MSTVAQEDPRLNERFHIFPKERIEALAGTAGVVGALSGFYDGVQLSSLRYLVENGHRLPKTVGAWYFYHKKKNYVMMIGGVRAAVIQGVKYSSAVGSVFALEAMIDHYVRNDAIDFVNTTAASMIVAASYAACNRMTYPLTKRLVLRGMGFGLSLGITQDLLIFARGGHVWYLNKIGIKNPVSAKEVTPLE